MIAKVDERLRDKDMGIVLTEAAKVYVATKGYDPVLGARPLRRTIQRDIEDTLSEEILYGRLRPGQIVAVDVTDEGTDHVHLTCGGATRAPLPDPPPVEPAGAASEPAAAGEEA